MSDDLSRTFIVLTGLPASGKTTLGRALAYRLRLPFYDKDEILEGLFESLGAADAAWRRRLSRASDEVLMRLVRDSAGGVVASFWRGGATPEGSGTPTDWLGDLGGNLLEIHCRCAPETAVDRFMSRSRHPGHLDRGRERDELLASFRRLAADGPLGLGPVIVVDTDAGCDPDGLLAEIRERGIESKE